MNPLIWRRPPTARCSGDGCTSGLDTWPLHFVRDRAVLCRLCSSCLLLSQRSLYCCCCFFLLGTAPPSQYADADPLLAPPAPTVTCLVCHEAVAHLSCLHSACGVFVCPACTAAAAGRPFSYAPSSGAPLDVLGARVVLLSTRMALALLHREANEVRAMGQRIAEECAHQRKQAYRELGMAFGIDPTLPSTKDDITPPENTGPEGSNEANMDMALDLNEPAPPPSPATLTTGTEGACREMATASADPGPPFLATLTIGMEGVCAEMATASTEAPPPRTLQLFWKDNDEEEDDHE